MINLKKEFDNCAITCIGCKWHKPVASECRIGFKHLKPYNFKNFLEYARALIKNSVN